jgi:hypothetical protein
MDRVTYEIGVDTVIRRGARAGQTIRVELDEIQIGDRVTLRLDESGNVAESVEATASVAAAPRAPVISAPKGTFNLDDDLIVEGTAAPGSRVTVEVTYTGRAFGALPTKGTFGKQEVTADRDGAWETEAFTTRIPIGVRRPTLTITVVARDRAGTDSKPVTATLETR